MIFCVAPALDVDGAAIYAQNSWPTIENCVFQNLSVSGRGGAIFATMNANSYSFLQISHSRYFQMNNFFLLTFFLFSENRFSNCKSTSGGAISVSLLGYSTLIVTSSDFMNNIGGGFGEQSIFSGANNTALILNDSSFSNINGSEVNCGVFSSGSNNRYCGPENLGCTLVNFLNSTNDLCGICGGNNSNVDCFGECFGIHVNDTVGSCCLESEKDCLGHCNGNGKNKKKNPKNIVF